MWLQFKSEMTCCSFKPLKESKWRCYSLFCLLNKADLTSISLGFFFKLQIHGCRHHNSTVQGQDDKMKNTASVNWTHLISLLVLVKLNVIKSRDQGHFLWNAYLISGHWFETLSYDLNCLKTFRSTTRVVLINLFYTFYIESNVV